MENYWKVTVVFSYPTDNEKTQKVKEEHLVKGISPTDVETKVHQNFGTEFPFEITSVIQTKIISVFE
jgi:hypothetical protein